MWSVAVAPQGALNVGRFVLTYVVDEKIVAVAPRSALNVGRFISTYCEELMSNRGTHRTRHHGATISLLQRLACFGGATNVDPIPPAPSFWSVVLVREGGP